MGELSCKTRELFKKEGVINRVKCHKEVSKKFSFALTRIFCQKEEQFHGMERSGLKGVR